MKLKQVRYNWSFFKKEKGMEKYLQRKKDGLSGNGARHILLAKWLNQNFGPDLKFIDVAGGSGQLTRALLDPNHGNAFSSVVIDPR